MPAKVLRTGLSGGKTTYYILYSIYSNYIDMYTYIYTHMYTHAHNEAITTIKTINISVIHKGCLVHL